MVRWGEENYSRSDSRDVSAMAFANALMSALSKASTVPHSSGNALEKVVKRLVFEPLDSGLRGYASRDLERSGIAKSQFQRMPPL